MMSHMNHVFEKHFFLGNGKNLEICRPASAEGTSQIELTQFDKPPCNIETDQSTKFRKNIGNFLK